MIPSYQICNYYKKENNKDFFDLSPLWQNCNMLDNMISTVSRHFPYYVRYNNAILDVIENIVIVSCEGSSILASFFANIERMPLIVLNNHPKNPDSKYAEIGTKYNYHILESTLANLKVKRLKYIVLMTDFIDSAETISTIVEFFNSHDLRVLKVLSATNTKNSKALENLHKIKTKKFSFINIKKN